MKMTEEVWENRAFTWQIFYTKLDISFTYDGAIKEVPNMCPQDYQKNESKGACIGNDFGTARSGRLATHS